MTLFGDTQGSFRGVCSFRGCNGLFSSQRIIQGSFRGVLGSFQGTQDFFQGV